MKAYQPARGTRDLYGDEILAQKFVTDGMHHVAHCYGYGEIITPIFEFTEVFARGMGEVTDVVSKEMYTFNDRGGESITLRPEGTAGAARALVSNGLAQDLPLKVYYIGPMFRYERPQKGRYRQFYQAGVELFGVDTPNADVEVIALANSFLKKVGVKGKITLEINSLGDVESREEYKKALLEYFKGYEENLSEDSKRRLHTNPLRILDSKEECDKVICENAPKMNDYLNEFSKNFFDEVLKGLDALEIEYKVNSKLVRGLDYYRHTVFEFITDELGSQGTVLAGGRYDDLVSELGGPKITGVGFASGVDRLALLLKETPNKQRPVAVIPLNDEYKYQALKIADDLRAEGVFVDMAFNGNVGKRFKKANKANAFKAIVVGGDEFDRGNVVIKDLDSGNQKEVSIKEISKEI
ncbi:MAG: Histidine--tRNA ligase [Alphaproteobacteria bacterium ADurb.Bin438]|nr:MAG: Histidine--tRNA ligase [Alphaproteobacteria bacterium ADurb.Bin438]